MKQEGWGVELSKMQGFSNTRLFTAGEGIRSEYSSAFNIVLSVHSARRGGGGGYLERTFLIGV